jgi:hypothetical protein
VSEIEISLCRRERPGGQCVVYHPNDESGGEHAQYENKDL